MDSRLTRVIERWLWAALILLLPVTSAPFVSKLGGGSMVAPASAIPMLLLMLIAVLPRLVRGDVVPRQIVPILAFALAALFCTACGFFIEIPLFRDINRVKNALSALVTLLIGLGFYLTVVTCFTNPQQLRWAYAWVNLSGGIMILWSGLQFIFWQTEGAYPGWMEQIQQFVSVSGNLYDRRVTGLAFEPSWLGHQLVMLYLPYWLAASITRSSAFNKKILGISVENGLLIAGIAILILSLARSALVSFLLGVALLVILGTGKGVTWIRNQIALRQPAAGKKALSPHFITAAVWVCVALLILVATAGGLFVLTRLDSRMENLFALLKEPLSFQELAKQLIFGERVAFWQTGLAVFADHPLFGVGLNSAGFFFTEKMTPLAWSLVEPHKLYYSTSLPNPLSLWVRLLAETGMLGFSIFVSWLILMGKTAAVLWNHSNPIIRTAAVAGALTLAALLMEGMSVDTFAFPYYWLSLGWLTSAVVIEKNLKSNPDTSPGVTAAVGAGAGPDSSTELAESV